MHVWPARAAGRFLPVAGPRAGLVLPPEPPGSHGSAAINEIEDYRFGQARRLRTKQDFDRVFRKPVRSSDRLFTVLARKTRCTDSRLGLAISVKSAGGAAGRNRVKRLVRECFRANRTRLSNIDIVVMSKPGIAATGNRKITESLEAHWERIGKRCAESC